VDNPVDNPVDNLLYHIILKCKYKKIDKKIKCSILIFEGHKNTLERAPECFFVDKILK